MPTTYAHYRFGAAMLGQMPADVSRTVKRHRRLYDVGLHGPDLFFFYKPMLDTRIGKMGSKFHRQTGREFFSRVCRNLRMEPSEEGQAYLYGVLCHYALDSQCHPLIIKRSQEGIASHSSIETEFDRFLLETDGKTPPDHMRLTKHMTLTARECAVAARFYPGAEAKHIRESLKTMAYVRKALELPQGAVRSAVIKTASAASETFRDMVITSQPDQRCEALNSPLLDAYTQAAQRFPQMLRQIGSLLTYNAPLGEDFAPIFG